MIFDNIKNCEQYYSLNKNFKKAFEFLLNTDLKNFKDDRYYIEDDVIYANVQSMKTKKIEDKKWEAHRDYIDIQFVISGREKMGFGLKKDFTKTISAYDKNKDIEFLDGEIFNFIDVFENNFVIFYPNDVHAPMLSVDDEINIKKVIVKIKI